jgi:hypothetical protein
VEDHLPVHAALKAPVQAPVSVHCIMIFKFFCNYNIKQSASSEVTLGVYCLLAELLIVRERFFEKNHLFIFILFNDGTSQENSEETTKNTAFYKQ